MTLTEGMNAEQIIEFAKTRPEFPWQWGIFLNGKETDDYAKENGLTLHWCEPIRPGDIYLAIHPVEPGYSFDFSKCVKVT
jgi:hypothetical protein